MIKRLLFSSCLLFVSVTLNAQKASEQLNLSAFEFNIPTPSFTLAGPFDYVAPDLKGENLFQYLHKNTEIKTAVTYNTSKGLMFSSIDNNPCENNSPGIVAFYSLICVNGTSSSGASYKEKGDQNGDGYTDSDGMNVEHLWPQSFFKENLPMKADIHHLRPTFIKPNGMRAAYPFCETKDYVYSLNSGAKLGDGCFEPPDEVKGEVARAMLYFVVRYYDRAIKPADYNDFFTSRIDMFLKWNRQDPPTAKEKERNDRIYQYQGNRNPFVDDYTLAEKIGQKVFESH